MSNIINISHISKTFKVEGKSISALKDVSLNVSPGEFISIVGPSGCGKSTLLRIMTKLDTPSSGNVEIHSQKPLSLVFQQFALFPWLTVAQNIAFPLQMRSENSSHIVRRLLSEMKLTDFADKHPKELSGGMKQRVGIARALAVSPEVLFMDEPFSALDALTASDLRAQLLQLWHDRNLTIVSVTHLIEEAVELADKVVVLSPRPGQVVAEVTINLPRPRDKRSDQFYQLVDQIAALASAAPANPLI